MYRIVKIHQNLRKKSSILPDSQGREASSKTERYKIHLCGPTKHIFNHKSFEQISQKVVFFLQKMTQDPLGSPNRTMEVTAGPTQSFGNTRSTEFLGHLTEVQPQFFFVHQDDGPKGNFTQKDDGRQFIGNTTHLFFFWGGGRGGVGGRKQGLRGQK